jgi:hypothetical protein
MEVDVSPSTTTDCPVTEEVLNPLICFSCDPIMFQLINDKAKRKNSTNLDVN